MDKKEKPTRILLMGNPNVGKSVFFSRLTGVHVIASNYPGTTVEFTKGFMHFDEGQVEVIDVPGTYTLEPTSPAEKVACQMLKEGDIVINVLDSTNLFRNLNLTLQLLKERLPMVIALNFWDETSHTGIKIDVKRLEAILGVPCVPTCAITGEGFNELILRLKEAKAGSYVYEDEERWHEIGKIVEEVEELSHRHHRLGERLADLTINPWSGIPIALIILFTTFNVIRFIGEGLVGWIFKPFFEFLWAPLMLRLSGILGSSGFVHDILIGRLIEGKIDFNQSFGLLTTGLFVEFAGVFPYIFSFYLILSLLEDSGYLPRLAVLMDTFLHRLGLHGGAVIPMILGLGCNVAGVLGTRIMETKRERFIATTLMAIAVPCMAQTAMIVGLVGRYGSMGLLLVFTALFLVWIILGLLQNRLLPGESMEIFLEIPPYRRPQLRAISKKVWIRIVWFIREATPWLLAGVFLANILYTLGIIELLGRFATPLISGIWGLPPDAVGALLIGFLRKDIAVGMLVPLDLTLPQLVVASVVLAMYFPCVATLATLIKELGVLEMIKASFIMLSSTLIVGGLLNLIL